MTGAQIFLEGIITQLIGYARRAVTLMESVQIGPLNWWQWMVALFSLGLIFAAIHRIAGSSGSGPSLTEIGRGSSEVVSKFSRRK